MAGIAKAVLSVLSIVFLLSALPSHSSSLAVHSSSYGPRTEDLIMTFYESVSSAYDALTSGEIDVLGYEIDRDLFELAINDHNIVLAPVADLGMYEFDINNNYTIDAYPGIRSPTSYQGFRQALAFLVDKNHIVNDICGGFAERIDQPIAAPLKSWGNVSLWYPNYPYEYNPQAAANLLDTAGFPQGSTPNPHYDPTFPGSAQYLRTYPEDHPQKPGQDLDSIVVVIRSDDYRRLDAGILLLDNMRKHGIPAYAPFPPWPYETVMGDRNYHIYTGSWSYGRFPPMMLYGSYHSSGYYPYGPNYVTGVNATGDPNYPHLDRLLEAARYPDTYEEAVSSTKLAASYMIELCITIPLFSAKAFWAWSRNLLGVINMKGWGPENAYTFMNAYKQDGSAIRFGMKSPPNAMNVIYSAHAHEYPWYYDYQCLNRMNLISGFDLQPYDLSSEQAGFTRDWAVDVWDDSGTNKTKVTNWLADGSFFVEPVTGNQKAQVNASHFFFTAWYLYQISDAWATSVFEDLHHINIINDFQVDVYFNTLSIWNTYYARDYMLPIEAFLQPPLTYNATETFVEGINLTTPGIVNLSGKPVWISSAEADGTPLALFTDCNIVAHGSANGTLEILTDLPNATVVIIDYWRVGDAYGYTAGDLPWQIIFEGAGMYYAVDFVPGVGGHLTLKRNPYYWMETPPLGEIDWAWTWQSGPKPRNGSYKIDIFDIVMTATGGTYHAQAIEIPDPGWLPGADVAPQGGVIDIFDIVTITSKYGQEWGYP